MSEVYTDEVEMLSQDADLDEALERVRYQAGMLLGIDATRAEQSYHRRRLTRQQYWLQGYGTLAGMRVRTATDAGSTRVIVGQGIGIDALGREVLVDEEYCLNLNDWLAAQAPARLANGLDGNDLLLKVMVRYTDCAVKPTPTAARRLNFGTDGVSYSRIKDALHLELVPIPPVVADDSFKPWANHPAVPIAADITLTDTETNFLAAVVDAQAQQQLELHARMLFAFEDQSIDPELSLAEIESHARLLLADIRIPMTSFDRREFNAGGIEVNNLTRPFLANASQTAHLLAQ